MFKTRLLVPSSALGCLALLPACLNAHGETASGALSDDKRKPSAYTAFLFEGIDDPKMAHVTHVYLGNADEEQLAKVEEVVGAFFAEKRLFPRARFTERQMFGANKDVPVLTPKSFDPKDWFPDLRERLLTFRPDTFTFSPHVTTKENEMDRAFSSYVLIFDGKVRKSWPNPAARESR